MGPAEAHAQGFRFSDEPVRSSAGVVDGNNALGFMRAATANACRNIVSVHTHALLAELWDVIDPLRLDFLADGLAHGFNAAFNGDRELASSPPNMRSAEIRRSVVSKALDKSLSKGEIVGWFTSPPFVNLRVNPLGLVPKDEGKAWRLVENFSAGGQASINANTDDVHLQFDRFDEAVLQFAKAGPGVLMIVFDKSSAYTSVPLRPQDWHLTGIYWPEKGYAFSACFKFGAKRSSSAWEHLAAAVQAAIKRRTGLDAVFRWVDDFFCIISVCASRAREVTESIIDLASFLDFTLKPEKCTGPAKVAVWTGIGFRSGPDAPTLFMPLAKRQKYSGRLRNLMRRDRWSLHDLRSIVGTLRHCLKIFSRARGALHKFVRLLKAVESRFRRGKRVSSSDFTFKAPVWGADIISLWVTILSSWQGTSLALVCAARLGQGSHSLHFRIDAAMKWGQGVFCLSSGAWLKREFTHAQHAVAFRDRAESTGILETFALLTLLFAFQDVISGQVVLVECDNSSVVTNASRGWSDTSILDEMFRLYTAAVCVFDCHIIVRHIPQQENGAADALSRNDHNRFLAEARELGTSPAPSPVPYRSASGPLSKIAQSICF
jgi:hypothetical protein